MNARVLVILSVFLFAVPVAFACSSDADCVLPPSGCLDSDTLRVYSYVRCDLTTHICTPTIQDIPCSCSGGMCLLGTCGMTNVCCDGPCSAICSVPFDACVPPNVCDGSTCVLPANYDTRTEHTVDSGSGSCLMATDWSLHTLTTNECTVGITLVEVGLDDESPGVQIVDTLNGVHEIWKEELCTCNCDPSGSNCAGNRVVNENSWSNSWGLYVRHDRADRTVVRLGVKNDCRMTGAYAIDATWKISYGSRDGWYWNYDTYLATGDPDAACEPPIDYANCLYTKCAASVACADGDCRDSEFGPQKYCRRVDTDNDGSRADETYQRYTYGTETADDINNYCTGVADACALADCHNDEIVNQCTRTETSNVCGGTYAWRAAPNNQTDECNCGTCNNACGAAQTCNAGVCGTGCGGWQQPCCSSFSCTQSGTWCDHLVASNTTAQGLVHGNLTPGICCANGEVALWNSISGKWECLVFDDCSPYTPVTIPPQFFPSSSCSSPLQACCAGIIQTSPSAYEAMCIALGETQYSRDFITY